MGYRWSLLCIKVVELMNLGFKKACLVQNREILCLTDIMMPTSIIFECMNCLQILNTFSQEKKYEC